MWQAEVCGLEDVSNFAKFKRHGNLNIAISKIWYYFIPLLTWFVTI